MDTRTYGRMDGRMDGREHAVVLGASMAGLLTARVLSEHFDRVSVVERDVLPPEGAHRRGVPQGRHVHALLPRGGVLLEELFPGLVAELAGAGAPLLEDLSQMHFEVLGHRLSRARSPLRPVGVQASRPVLEAAVRRRVCDRANVEVLDGRDVLGLVATPQRERVCGVRVQRRDVRGGEEVLGADLVVDATGRGGRTPAALAEWGYGRPVEETVQVDITYTSVPVRLRPGSLDASLFLIGPRPGRLTSMGLFAHGDGAWLLTVMGYGAAAPAPDLDSMLDRVAEMAPPEVVTALHRAEALDDVRVHRYPASRRRRYERLRRFPRGLLVVGDALCSFNPVYGQGMTVAAEEAVALGDALAAGADRTLARRYFRSAARHVDVAWRLSVGSDLALPEIPGRRSLEVRAVNHYLARVLATAARDPEVATRLLRVIGFVDPPTALLAPRVAARVLRGPRRDRRPPADPARRPVRHARADA